MRHELEDGPDPGHSITRDPTWSVRKLAAAVLIQAVHESRQKNSYYRTHAVRFLYPESEPGRRHLHFMAELAGSVARVAG